MIPGFEEETAPLSPLETDMVPTFVMALARKVGEANAVTSTEMAKGLKQWGIRADGPRIRKIINHIRMNQLVRNLIATSNGYYIENDPAKLEEYKTGLRKRARSINAIADSYE